MTRLNRRHFLAALGASSALFGFTGERRARAEPELGSTAGRPVRFIGVYTPHGRAHELWQPRAGFDIGFADASLKPFDDPATYGKSFKDRMLVIDGVDLTAGIAVGTTGHDAPRVILTGSGADGKNASIDQYLALERGLGAITPHSSVVLGIGNDQTDIGANISYASGGTPIPKWIDPAQTFVELFALPLGGKSGKALARERRLGKSVLDVLRGDLHRLAAHAPRSEKIKLEQHQTALREIEKRLSGIERRCAPPPTPDKARFPRLRAYGGGEPYFDAITDLQIDLLARALSCDLTRFSTLFLADLTRTAAFAELPNDVHGDVAHRYDARRGTHPGNAASWHLLAIQNRYSYGKVARLLARLAEGGVLDDTIVYVSGDMGDPAAHSSSNVPTLIFNGAKSGRYIDLRRAGAEGVPNNRILVSICQAFGVDSNRFGHSANPRVVTGRLAELDA